MGLALFIGSAEPVKARPRRATSDDQLATVPPVPSPLEGATIAYDGRLARGCMAAKTGTGVDRVLCGVQRNDEGAGVTYSK